MDNTRPGSPEFLQVSHKTVNKMPLSSHNCIDDQMIDRSVGILPLLGASGC